MRKLALLFSIFLCLQQINLSRADDFLINLPPRIAVDATPKASYDGVYFISLIEREYKGKMQTSFQILDRDATLLFQAGHWYNQEENLTFLWDLESRVWVYSPEKGLFYWQARNKLTWAKNDFKFSKVLPPPYLKKTFPGYFEALKPE